MLVFLFGTTMHAQVLPSGTYTTRDGLPSNTILAVFQDSRGYIWIGTNNGLSRYDGAQFATYSTVQGLSNNWITDITESPREPGTLWIGTIAGGVNRLRNGSISVFRPGKDDASNNISSVAVDTSGTAWATTSYGLFMIRGDSIQRVTQVEGGRSDHLMALDDGTVWLARDNHLSFHAPNESVWVSVPSPSPALGFITELARSKTGGVWVGWSSGRVTRMQGITGVYELRGRFGVPQRIADDGNGRLWIKTRKALITLPLLSPENARLVPFTPEERVPADVIPPMLMDAESNLWLGTWLNGLVKLSDRNLHMTPARFSPRDAYSTSATSDRGGHIWVSARGGIVEFYPDNAAGWRQHFHRLEGISPDEDCYVGLYDRSGRIWLISKGYREIRAFNVHSEPARPGRLFPSTVLRRGRHFPEGMLLSLFVDAQNRMFISIGKVGIAVVSLDPPVLQGIMTQGDGIPGQNVRALLQDNAGQIWMGGWNDGVSVFSPGSTFPRFVRRYAVSDGLPDNSIQALHQDRSGVMWIGTRHGGVARLEQGRLRTISMNDGLLSNSIWRIEEDEHDRLYLLTDAGIERIDRNTGAPLMQKSELLVPQGGTLGIVTGKYIWYASTEGLTTYDYAAASTGARPPPVHIRSLTVNGRILAIEQGIELPFSQNTCTIEYVGISYRDEKAVRYQYRLSGVDSGWSPSIAHRSVTFANLHPGRYLFEVRAISGEGVASTVPASLAFSIIPPIWQRWWFITLAVAVAGTFLYAGFRYRVRHILELERLRTRIAADLHDDVGTNLSSMMLTTQIMERKFPLSEEERRELDRIRVTAGHTREMLKDIVWFLNPQNDSPENFIFKLKEIAERILQDTPFRFHTSGVEHLEHVNLEAKRNIVLMFKEILTNIVKHAQAASVDIDATCRSGSFFLTVGDDGRGFDMGAPSTGNGIVNLRTRTRTVGGQIEIRSAPGEGTLIRLSMNITHMRSGRRGRASVYS